MHKIFVLNKFISCLYMFRAPCAHHQEVKIALHSLWYHHTYRVWRYQRLCNAILTSWWWAHCARNMLRHEINLSWNKKFCASSWLITEINILRCSTVSKTSKFHNLYWGADKSLARPGRKQATFPTLYGTWRFITTFTSVHHLSLP